MTITISTEDILQGIYASSALATMSRDCPSALLHPDHADALRHTVRDALAAIASASPGACIKVINTPADTIGVEIHDSVHAPTATATLRHALVSTAASLIASAAGLQPLPSIPQSLYEPFLPSWSTATIARA